MYVYVCVCVACLFVCFSMSLAQEAKLVMESKKGDEFYEIKRNIKVITNKAFGQLAATQKKVRGVARLQRTNTKRETNKNSFTAISSVL